MELVKQIISKNQIVRSNTVQELNEFDSQPLSTQAKIGEQTVSMMLGN